ncbi:MAG: OsmC family protein [Gemmatimonadales bacterium]
MSDDPNLRHAAITWDGDLVFTGGAPDGPSITMDSAGVRGPSPVTALLLAGAGCSGMDVVSILEKQRATLVTCRIEAIGRRAADHPRRITEVTLRFHLTGEGITRAGAERAVELSVSKYCSVMLSLNPDIPVTTEVVLG